MAPHSHGTGSRLNGVTHGTSNGFAGNFVNQPPPSTLAAQLVDNISTPKARSSHPDETNELKRLFSVIERIKDQPDLLRTDQERIEHNHILIYVYTRIALDGLQWDNPFAKNENQAAEAAKALNFLQVTITETPAVLKYTAEDKAFLFRGREPLWLWLLPRVLRMLGSEQCTSLTPAIERLCVFVVDVVNKNTHLWDIGPHMMLFFQTTATAIAAHIAQLHISGEDEGDIENVAFEPLKLVPSPALQHAVGSLDASSARLCTYTMASLQQAVNHIAALLHVLKTSILPPETPDSLTNISCSTFPPFQHHLVWLLDFVASLNQVFLRCGGADIDIPVLATVVTCLDIVNAHGRVPSADGISEMVTQQMYGVLVTSSSGCLEMSRHLLATAERIPETQYTLCLALLKIARAVTSIKPVVGLIKSHLLRPLKTFTSEYRALGHGTDLWRLGTLLEQIVTSQDPVAFPEEVRSQSFQDARIGRQVARLHPRLAREASVERPTKRLRHSKESSSKSKVLGLLDDLLPGCLSATDANYNENKTLEAFGRLEMDDRCSLIELVSRLCCAADDTLTLSSSRAVTLPRMRCSFCCDDSNMALEPSSMDIPVKRLASTIFSMLIHSPDFTESKRARVVGMIALRRVLRHCSDAELWDLQRPSGPGQWCSQSLQSSLRELRLAAGRALAVFVEGRSSSPVNESILERNRVYVIGVLKLVSNKNIPHLHESCIAAWGQIGRVAPDEELNLVLLQFLEYLGHRNMIISASAFNEIIAVADARRMKPSDLFAPFWRTCGFTAIKDLVSKPQTCRMVAELMQTSVPELLLLVQSYALPWLILTKRREVVQKLAEARGEKETWMICIDGSNLGPILALLLVQEVPNLEEYCMSLFRHVSPHFDNVTLVELLGSEAAGTALELFKACGDADENRKPRVRAALNTMASLLMNDHGNKKNKHHLGRFFQQHALGLTSRFSEVITDSLQQNPPVQEQRRYIKGMEEMIRVCKAYARIARPQISACLLSALANDELRSAAFSCWHALLTYMEEEDIEALLETTFFITDHFWDSFEQSSRQEVMTMLSELVDGYPDLMNRAINKLPSLDHIEDLASVNKYLNKMRTPLDNRQVFGLFVKRLDHENSGVVLQTLRELASYLKKNQAYLQTSAISDQPDSLVLTLSRALLDCSAKYNGSHLEVARACAECIGLVGCLDSNRVEAPREQRQFVVMDNFDTPGETTDFVVHLLENVLVKAFLSATDTRYIGFLSYTMQGLLERCDFKVAYAQQGAGQAGDLWKKWMAISDTSKEVLTPFLSSKYKLAPMVCPPVEYPIFRPTRGYGNWLRAFVLDLLQKGHNLFAQLIFEPLCRVIRVKDTAVAEFLLPYLVVHVVVGSEGSRTLQKTVINELLAILQHEPKADASHLEREDIKHCYEAVFRVLDYAMRWLQATKAKYGNNPQQVAKFARMQEVLDSIHPELISQRAVYCRQYSLALFHLEPYYRREGSEKKLSEEEQNGLLQSMQDIYAQIDDPDGLEGMIATVANVDINQMILSHKKAGRWEATQTWYEIRLAEDPNNLDVQLDLLTCLKESGQHDVLLNYVEGMSNNMAANKIAPFAVEASWATGRWEMLRKYLSFFHHAEISEEFNLGIAQALLYLKDGDQNSFRNYLQTLRDKVASELSQSSTASFRACHSARLKCHVLADLDLIVNQKDDSDTRPTLRSLERRLEILGAYVTDKQYVLSIRRAAMELVRPTFTNVDIASLWLSSARLARKAGSTHQSFNAVLHADRLGDGFAKIENARLLWKDGHHRKAIQLLHCAIDNNSFINESVGTVAPTSSKNPVNENNLLTARAHLLLAKWQDSAGQTHASAQRLQYQQAARTYPMWEKGHYYLGRHYKKILESERGLKPGDQSDAYMTGETAKLVIENYLRSLNFGTKYLYQTLPSVLTIWLEIGAQVKESLPNLKVAASKELHDRRVRHLNEVHDYISKNLQRLPTYIFYTALPQIVARIAHPNEKVFALLQEIIVKVVEAHPRQALWNLFACMTSKVSSERRQRGQKILQRLRSMSKKVDDGMYDLKQLLRMGEKLAEQLLLACNNGEFQSNRTVYASITRDLNFNHKCTPCPLVVPIEACLTATLPTLTDNVKKHKAFSRDVITIDSFLDEVLVLGSLAKPRRLTARGSDGKNYGLLIKPKDDLRTDQRLMEFNSMINRSLKRDAESSRRQLYIRTYAVTPLNEECGIIEWVDGLKTIRDILLGLYKTRGISPNYASIAQLMKNACADAPRYPHLNLFTETVLGMFPPVLPEWFISQFPHPEAWFAARLRYTRSCAVMSMVGTILGLGDRHGENLLLEEGNGGIFHVDFNCLFDKGLTFAQPERVPFRLTHNMVAAMGIYGVEGPFRQCSELTLKILRAQEETLMTILEAFIYDPTLDLQRDKKRKNEVVRLNPTSVVESIKRKVRGLLPDESIPLGVEGQVEELVKQAVDPRNLAGMYIGWCPFL